ncbi:MAG: SPASM domain-containing protein, partial [Elusimicrobia bacterium]|nr:SPASM domain-containing protein [Elusimicrobiota bacterium]
RGMPGLFAKVACGLKQVNYFKAKSNKQKLLINLQCTINKYNYKNLEQLVSVADEVKADSLTFHNLIFLRQEDINKQKASDRLLNCSSLDWDGFVFNPGIDALLLFKKMQQILSRKYSFSVDFYPKFSKRALVDYYNKASYVPLEYPARCLSPWVSAYIFPDGEVRPCLNLDYSFGNIKNDRFKGLWNSAKAIFFRKFLKNKKIFSACVRCTELYRY